VGATSEADVEIAGDGPHTVTAERLQDALARTGGNRVEAACQIHISRSTLYRLRRKLPE